MAPSDLFLVVLYSITYVYSLLIIIFMRADWLWLWLCNAYLVHLARGGVEVAAAAC
jgi:hypothetical protein